MGISKTSRKGKKAWRRNLDSASIEDALQLTGAEKAQGTSVSGLSDDALFFVDTAPDEKLASQPGVGGPTGGRARRRKEKLLRCQAILQAPQANMRSAHNITKRKNSVKKQLRPHELGAEKRRGQPDVGAKPEVAAIASAEPEPKDLWDERGKKEKSGREEWTEVEESRRRVKRRMVAKVSPIAAVEVDPAGSSFNPDAEQHQDVVAEVVAVETIRGYDRELQPRAPPQHAPAGVSYDESDELQMLQAVEQEPDNRSEDSEGDLEGDGSGRAKTRMPPKKTQQDRNRQKRGQLQEREHKARQKLKLQRRQLEQLPRIRQEIGSLEELQRLAQLRKAADQDEKRRTLPPKLGKKKFISQAPQVLLTEECTGSLRILKPYSMLTKDRLRSAQKRGLVEVRGAVPFRQHRKRKLYIPGERNQRILDEALDARQRSTARHSKVL